MKRRRQNVKVLAQFPQHSEVLFEYDHVTVITTIQFPTKYKEALKPSHEDVTVFTKNNRTYIQLCRAVYCGYSSSIMHEIDEVCMDNIKVLRRIALEAKIHALTEELGLL